MNALDRLELALRRIASQMGRLPYEAADPWHAWSPPRAGLPGVWTQVSLRDAARLHAAGGRVCLGEPDGPTAALSTLQPPRGDRCET